MLPILLLLDITTTMLLSVVVMVLLTRSPIGLTSRLPCSLLCLCSRAAFVGSFIPADQKKACDAAVGRKSLLSSNGFKISGP